MKVNIINSKILDVIEKAEYCILCSIRKEIENRALENFLRNEVITNPEVREKVKEALGFCEMHMKLLYERIFKGGTEDGLVFCIYLQDIYSEILERLKMGRILQKGSCLICKYIEEMEILYEETFLKLLEEEEFRKKYKDSKGLCVKHFLKLKNEFTKEKEIEILEEINLSLLDYIKKRGWEFRHDKPPKEAPKKALIYLVGY
ncbi:hypothetical protein HRbin06_00255 [archaeon HR06]|nr:hypothetical protein HRbin06_00255 [archaeon HR06]